MNLSKVSIKILQLLKRGRVILACLLCDHSVTAECYKEKYYLYLYTYVFQLQ